MKKILFLFLVTFSLTACAEIELASHMAKRAVPPTKSQGTFKVGSPYKINGRYYYPNETYEHSETGIASWYGPQFHGKQTANGEIFDMNELTAAHRTLQMPSLVRVTNLENGRSLIVRVNDRGPYKRGRVIDVSKKAADLLGFQGQGTAKVRLEVLEQESREIAEAAKTGIDTSGYEVALNRSGSATLPQEIQPAAGPTDYDLAAAQAPARYQPVSAPATMQTQQNGMMQPQAVQREMLTSKSDSGFTTMTPGHTRNGAFYPDPVITETPVNDTNIYVQAGSFTVFQNANHMKTGLKAYGPSDVYPAEVNGKQYYRVRVGPLKDVQQADQILSSMMQSGNTNAIIIVD